MNVMHRVALTLALTVAAPLAAADNVKEVELSSRLAAIHAAGVIKDPKNQGKLTKAMMPAPARIKAAMRDGADPKLVDAILAMHAEFANKTEEQLAGFISAPPENTEVKVFGATTEEVAAYAKGSNAFNEFPAAAQKLAQTVLKPGVTWYEASFVKPGNPKGIKYHLFFADADGFAMLGPIWRVLKDAKK